MNWCVTHDGNLVGVFFTDKKAKKQNGECYDVR